MTERCSSTLRSCVPGLGPDKRPSRILAHGRLVYVPHLDRRHFHVRHDCSPMAQKFPTLLFRPTLLQELRSSAAVSDLKIGLDSERFGFSLLSRLRLRPIASASSSAHLPCSAGANFTCGHGRSWRRTFLFRRLPLPKMPALTRTSCRVLRG